jgi:catechol 2,3-dioxygenase-like lactoylglutathione lyase family enzyme
MRLSFIYHPVPDVEKAVAFYRGILGWDEAWRMGDDTAAMQVPGSEVQLMLAIDADPDAVASGFFEVDDVDAFCADLPEGVEVVDEPKDLDPIRYAAIADPGGNLLRLFTNLQPEE